VETRTRRREVRRNTAARAEVNFVINGEMPPPPKIDSPPPKTVDIPPFWGCWRRIIKTKRAATKK